MRRQTIPLGKVFGIPIGLDYSWFLIFGLATWSLAVSYFPERYAGWPTLQYWGLGAAAALMLFASVLLHELGHSLTALAHKVPVRRIRLLIFGGVAEIGDEPPSALAEFLIAIAGPAVSILLAGAFFVGFWLMRLGGAFEPFIALFGYLAFINLTLSLFNLIPGFPLDGGRVLRAIIWGLSDNLQRATQIAANVGRLVAFGFIGVGVIQMFTGNFGGGLWTAFIGMFLHSAASAELRVQTMRDLLSDRAVAHVMRRNYIAVPGDTTLQGLVNRYLLSGGRGTFVVVKDDGAVGLLSVDRIREVPPAERAFVGAGQVMTPVEQLESVQPDTPLWTALRKMDSSGQRQLPVTFDGRFLGLLRRDDVLGFARTLQAFGA